MGQVGNEKADDNTSFVKIEIIIITKGQVFLTLEIIVTVKEGVVF
jgi:F0F1-type ATP synthase alpha subunit